MESEYFRKLSVENPDVGQRYLLKLKIISGLDPFLINSQDLDYTINGVPPISNMDIIAYLVFSHSFYSKEQMKAFKSLQAYKYFESGFVVQAGTKIVDGFYILIGKVKHSQRTTLKPLEAWIIIEKDGSVCTAHCTCMAGNSEVCSHVGALLFAAEYAHSRKDALSCTDIQALWPMPSMSTQVSMVRVREMDWGKEYVLNEKVNSDIPPVSKIELKSMLEGLSKIGKSSTLMRIVEPYAEEISKQANKKIASILNIFKEEYRFKSYGDLMQIGKLINLSINRIQISEIEKATRSQSENQNWYAQRAGRITASKFRSVCFTNKNKPSLSLIKSICYPVKLLFTTKATSWGLTHEKDGVKAYIILMEEEKHENLVINEVGLLISERWPQLAATPDRLVYCECCNGGCLEVKCPYLLYTGQIQVIEEYLQMKSSCLVKENGKITLKKNHAYYYQVQMQIFVTEMHYCDFVIWSPSIVFKERILPDWEFWNEYSQVALKFHSKVILPELLGRFFTREEGMAEILLWCKCKEADDGRPMIKCDGDECETQWFHFQCVGLDDVPNSLWYCEDCYKKP